MKKFSLTELIDLQNKLHSCLNSYLNGSSLQAGILNDIKTLIDNKFLDGIDVIVEGFKILDSSLQLDKSKIVITKSLQSISEWEKRFRRY